MPARGKDGATQGLVDHGGGAAALGDYDRWHGILHDVRSAPARTRWLIRAALAFGSFPDTLQMSASRRQQRASAKVGIAPHDGDERSSPRSVRGGSPPQ